MMKKILWQALLVLQCINIQAQKKEEPKWDVNNPPGTFKEIIFTISEGTWVNLDVSPDGKQIVFDLLGDIYIVPVTGGEGKTLRSGLAFEVQPRFSPDGKKISFTSDAGGGDNIWTMNNDGSHAKQITKEDFRLLNNAVWSPDGNYLVARKHFTSSRSLGAGELWMYHISGGEGVQLTKRKNDQQDLGEPCYSPDGKSIYYSEDMYPGGFFQYNKDPNSQIYVIQKFDTEKGETETITGGSGGAVRPQVSRDGKHLAFVRRVRESSVLFIRNISTGEEWPVYDKLSKDQQEAWAIFGVYTNFNWLPDNKNIIIWSEGKIKRINIDDLSVNEIPFTVNAKHRIQDAIRFKNEAVQDTFTVRAIRHAETSPDGKLLVFNAAGYLWKKTLPEGLPERLTTGKDFEFEPSFSKSGDKIVYVTWSDEEKGSIMVLNLKKGSTEKITQEKGLFRTPVFSPDEKLIVFGKENGNDHQGFTFTVKSGLYKIPAAGGKMEFLLKKGVDPLFSADGKRIFFKEEEGDKKSFKSVNLNGYDERVHFTSKHSSVFIPSPDEKWIAFTELFRVYIAPFLPSGKTMEIGASGKSFPVAQAARDIGSGLHWSGDSQKLHWTTGDEYFAVNLTDRFNFLPGSRDSILPPDTTGRKIGLELKQDLPEGIIVFKGARIITMNNSKDVIDNGVIIINKNKITDVGRTSEIQIPQGAKVFDVTGKTIIPGLIDVHAHLGTFRYGLSPQKQWSYYANLAFGVTTTHDPSSNSEMVFSQSEMVKAGYMTGPRIFSTGWILYGAEGDYKAVINKYEDAQSMIRRTKSYGAFSVKSYNQPRREQRQMVIEAARTLKINVVPEGGSFFFHNLSMILDGHTGIEHNLPVATLYGDVIRLWSESKTAYTPTLIVSYGAMFGENYFYQKHDVWKNEKLLKYTPRFVIDSRSRHRTMSPDEEFDNGYMQVSRSCKKLADAGVKINMGAHGQLQGLGAHWEMWMLSHGGMSNMQVLESATINRAYYLGMEDDLGSLETGKLADLIILEKNPLEDILNSETVTYTMVNGRLYDTNTMNEIGNYDKPRGKFYWEQSKTGSVFPWHMNTHGDED